MNLASELKLCPAGEVKIRPKLPPASMNRSMQEKVLPMKATSIHIRATDRGLDLLPELGRHTFVDIHVQEPVAAGGPNALVSLMAEVLAR